MTRLIDADTLCEEFKKRQQAALRWKEGAILDDDEERKIRADAILSFLSEVKLTIDKAPTVFSCNACKNMGNERECVDCHDYSNYVHYEERQKVKEADNENGS